MKKLPQVISQKEFEEIFAEATKIERNTISKRAKLQIRKYRVAMLLGFESGMRISEILGWKDRVPELQKENVEDAQIKILSGKGSKDRIVPRPRRLNQKAIDLLPLNINRRSLQHFISRLGFAVLRKNISFHTLRHGFVTHLINQGRPLHEVQMLAGHSRLDTTGLYLHADPKKAIQGALDVF